METVKPIRLKEAYKSFLSEAKPKEGTTYKLMELSCQVGFKRLLKVAKYEEGIFVKHLTIEI